MLDHSKPNYDGFSDNQFHTASAQKVTQHQNLYSSVKNFEVNHVSTPIQNKASSVANILTSRNLRKKRLSMTPINDSSRLDIDHDEEPIRRPPVAYDPVPRNVPSHSQMLNDHSMGSNDFNMTTKRPIYERLYEEAQLKQEKQHEYERIKQIQDRSHCSFTPKTKRNQSRSRSDNARIEQLAQNDKDAKEQIYKMRRDAKEMEGCTFHPNINTTPKSTKNMTPGRDGSIFNRLYNDNQVRKKHQRNLEVDKQSF